MNTCLAATGVFLVLLGAEAARAAVVPNHSFTMEANGISARPMSETVEFSFGVYDMGWTMDWQNLPESKRRPVFTRLRLTEADVGRTIIVPASEIPGAIDLLTNGENNFVFWNLFLEPGSTGGNGGGAMEWPFLFGNAATPGPRDFAGERLTGIGVRVNELTLNQPVTGGSYRYDFSLNMVIVPEPAGLAPLGVGALALLRRRRVGAT